MLVNSPMADSGGGDATSEVITGTLAAITVTTPKKTVAGKTEISAMTCRSNCTGQEGDTFNNTSMHTTSAKMQHIHEGGRITAVVPSGDNYTSSDSRCICDIDLNIPLHKRLNANLTMHSQNEAIPDLDSGFLVEPNCSLSWTDSTFDRKVSSDSTVDMKESPDSTAGRNVSSDCTVDSKVSSDSTIDSKVLSNSTIDCKVSSHSTIENKVSSDITVESRVSSITIIDNKVTPDGTVDSRMSPASTADSKVSSDSTADSKVSLDKVPDNTVDCKVSSCDPTMNIGSSLCLMSVTDETCRKQSPASYEESLPPRTEYDGASEKQGQAEEAGQNKAEVTTTRIEENLTNWDPETPIKPTRKKRRKRRDTGDFLMIHMNMQTLEDFDTPDKSVTSPSDTCLRVRRSRRIRRKSIQLQQMVPPNEERRSPEFSVMKFNATAVVSFPTLPSDGSINVDVGSDTPERTFVMLHSSQQQEHIPTSDIMANEQEDTTNRCPAETTECLSIVPPDASSDSVDASSDQRSNRRHKRMQRVNSFETDISSEAPQKRGKKLEPVNIENLYNNHLLCSQMPAEDQRWTTIQEQDIIPGEPESVGVVAASHVIVKKRGRPKTNCQKSRRQSLTPLGEKEDMTALLGEKPQTLGDKLQDRSESLFNTKQEETGQHKPESTVTDSQESLADWDPEMPLKLTPKKHRRRRDTGDFMKVNMQTLEGFDTLDKSSVGSPSNVQFKLRQSRRIQRKSTHLQTMPPDGIAKEQIGPTENSAIDFADRTFVTLCTSSRQEYIPSDSATSDIMPIKQDDTTNMCPEHVAETTECISVVPPDVSAESVNASSDQRSNRRRKCTQRITIVEIDLSPETPKKKRKQKRCKKPEPVNLEDLYNNRLWRSQMPAEDQRWPTIPEEDDSIPGELESIGTVTATRINKQRAIKFSEFYSKARLMRRRQRARRQGWKPPRRKQVEKEAMVALLENKLQALDDELRLIDD